MDYKMSHPFVIPTLVDEVRTPSHLPTGYGMVSHDRRF